MLNISVCIRVTLVVLFLSHCIFVYAEDNNRYPRYTASAYTVERGSYPWIAKVNHQDYTCTGILATDRHVITAAHCLRDRVPVSSLVVQFNNASENFEVRGKRFVNHPVYRHEREGDAYSEQHDIAIIELDQPVNLSVPDINLDDFDCDDVFNITMPMAAGYRSRSTLKITPPLNWENGLGCNATDPGAEATYYTLTYEGIGQPGDSGGPLFNIVDDRLTIYGIARGVRGKAPQPPGTDIYFTKLSLNSDFLVQYLGDDLMGISGSDTGWNTVPTRPPSITSQPSPVTKEATSSARKGASLSVIPLMYWLTTFKFLRT